MFFSYNVGGKRAVIYVNIYSLRVTSVLPAIDIGARKMGLKFEDVVTPTLSAKKHALHAVPSTDYKLKKRPTNYEGTTNLA